MNGHQGLTGHSLNKQGASPTHGRAPAMLGAIGTTLAAAMTIALTCAAVLTWPGTAAVQLESALASACLGLAGLLAGWVCAVLAAATAHVATAHLGTTTRDEGRRVGLPSTPPPPVRLVSAALISLASSLAIPALAQAAEPMVIATTTHSADLVAGSAELAAGNEGQDITDPGVPAPGWTPTRGAAKPQTSADVQLINPSHRGADALPEHVVVHRGDTLWDIAARHLGRDATSSDVAQEWPRWYDANRDLIGPDPNFILPGQELVAPDGEGTQP